MEQLGFGEYRVNRQKKTIKTKEKPPMKGAVSRVKPLQSWVRFDYMAYRVQVTNLRFTTDIK